MKSIKWLFRYHLGSVAFGSLLLAIVWVFQIVAEYISVYDILILGKAEETGGLQ
jgi:Plasma-membrane choline transporter